MVDGIEDLERAICIVVDELAGQTASRTGPFIAGFIELEGPEYPNELFRQFNRAMKRTDLELTVSNAEQVRKQVWFLKEVNVLEEVTLEIVEDTPRDEFDKRFYDTTDDVDMSWLEDDIESIALALAGRSGNEGVFAAIGQPAPATIPPEILNPQRIYYEQNNPESAYLEGSE
ncbi:hypothetical protein HYG81_21505 (plasmid) [Natrinema zhouii]|uniref:hypothetical protein n=1 Tax=Natrinema zhouii TaxID=1710539 RepID=UPI001CFFF7EB|nr:hypothetical protein [Natrinema zhouii]UHQ98154.1 hypothetical protein HYG81_21505 [Natrinema zhouii]